MKKGKGKRKGNCVGVAKFNISGSALWPFEHYIANPLKPLISNQAMTNLIM